MELQWLINQLKDSIKGIVVRLIKDSLKLRVYPLYPGGIAIHLVVNTEEGEEIISTAKVEQDEENKLLKVPIENF